ncbi:glcP [Symbiodinium natans]|uniref:GlcP protein n=1 Tax=Symbiodinium natans TaxID=878477 RepID=A0A812QFQ3_9DINO|nr:glcP [Symbiodinium natans]
MGGPAADAYGRRLAVLLAYFGLVVCGLCSAISVGPMSMLVARFFFGLFYGFGMGPSLTLQVEICPKAWRGHMVNVNNFFFTLGEVYAAWLLWAFLKDLKQTSDEESWRYVTALAVSVGLRPQAQASVDGFWPGKIFQGTVLEKTAHRLAQPSDA